MQKPVGVILAGGQARRMGMDRAGGDKGLLELDGQTLLGRVVKRLTPQVELLAINANGDAGRFAEFNLPVIGDSIEGFAGPLAGILAGMDWAAEQGASHVISAAADTPFFPLDLVTRLQSATEGQHKPIALAATPDPKRGMMRQPTFGLWPVNLREDLRDALNMGTRKIVQWTDRHGTALAPFEVIGIDPFFNVNTFADMELAEEIIEVGDL